MPPPITKPVRSIVPDHGAHQVRLVVWRCSPELTSTVPICWLSLLGLVNDMGDHSAGRARVLRTTRDQQCLSVPCVLNRCSPSMTLYQLTIAPRVSDLSSSLCCLGCSSRESSLVNGPSNPILPDQHRRNTTSSYSLSRGFTRYRVR